MIPSPPPPLPPLFPPLAYSIGMTISVFITEPTIAIDLRVAHEVKSQLRGEISRAIDCDAATEDDCRSLPPLTPYYLLYHSLW